MPNVLEAERIGCLGTEWAPAVDVVLPIVQVRVRVESEVVCLPIALDTERCRHKVCPLNLGDSAQRQGDMSRWLSHHRVSTRPQNNRALWRTWCMINAFALRTTPLDRHALPPNADRSRTASVAVLITGAVVEVDALACTAGVGAEICRAAVLIVGDSEQGLSKPSLEVVVVDGRKAE